MAILYVHFHDEAAAARPMDTGAAGRTAVGAPARDQRLLGGRWRSMPGHTDQAALYPRLLDLLADVTPILEALPPSAALLDVRGAVRYFGRGPRELAELIQVRALARYAVPCTIGVAGNRLLATMAAQSGSPGEIKAIADDPSSIAEFLRPLPVAALYGVGPATAATLTRHGLHTIGNIADTPLSTLQRLLGGAAGRRLHDHARGIDPRPVVPGAPAQSLAAEHAFPLDVVDAAEVTRELLGLAVQLGAMLRDQAQVAHGLTLVVRYADGSTTTRSRSLAQPTAGTQSLNHCARRIYDGLGLQRARVRSIRLRVERLTSARSTPVQLTLDEAEEEAARLDAAADRFGSSWVHPAGLLRGPRRPHDEPSGESPGRGAR